MAKVKERVILPGSYLLRPQPKNFLAENVKNLRNLQKQVQKKTTCQTLDSFAEKRRSKVKQTHLVRDPSPSIKSRISTPITALESAKPVKNQRVQTVTEAALKTGKLVKPSTRLRDKSVHREPFVHVTNFQDTSADGDDHSAVEESRSRSGDRLKQLKKIVSVSPTTLRPTNAEGNVKENKDFVETNTYKLYTEKPRRSKPDPSKLPPNYKRGEVPKYLHAVKRELLKSEENEALDPDCPPGFIKLSDEDRQAHLSKLKLTQNELIRKQNSLPLRVDTMMMKQRKSELDRELSKIEEAVKLFSRDKLYVKITG